MMRRSVVVLGSSNSGKTSMVRRLVLGNDPPQPIGNLVKTGLIVDRTPLVLTVAEGYGHQRFQGMNDVAIAHSDLALVLFNITDRGGFERPRLVCDV